MIPKFNSLGLNSGFRFTRCPWTLFTKEDPPLPPPTLSSPSPTATLNPGKKPTTWPTIPIYTVSHHILSWLDSSSPRVPPQKLKKKSNSKKTSHNLRQSLTFTHSLTHSSQKSNKKIIKKSNSKNTPPMTAPEPLPSPSSPIITPTRISHFTFSREVGPGQFSGK